MLEVEVTAGLQLDRVRYDIYYDVRPGKVVILAFWHSNRGATPRL